MDHKHDQLWGEVLRRLGCKNIGELLLRDPAQLTVLLADLTHLQSPPPVAIYGATVLVGAGGAGTFGTIELQCRAQGTYIIGLTFPPAMEFRLYTLAGPTGLGGNPPTAALHTAFSDGRNGQNWLDDGTPGVLGGADCLRLNNSGSGALGGGGYNYAFPEPMFVASNRTFGMQCGTANTAVNLGIMWREIGLGG